MNDNRFKKILRSSDGELNALYDRYTGFYKLMQLLEKLALCTSQGIYPKDTDELLSIWQEDDLEQVEPEDDPVREELHQIVMSALFQLKKIIDDEVTQKPDFLNVISLFLTGVISSAADLAELALPDSAPIIYANVEAAAKMGGLRAIKKLQLERGAVDYSVSNIRSDDMTTAMNYLGQELATTLFKTIHELPLGLRSPEMLVRGIEAMLANLLHDKFSEYNPHKVLDDFCEHVHTALNDLKNRKKKGTHLKRVQ
jgi:hypothetical protein